MATMTGAFAATPAIDKDAAALVPAEIQKSGVLNVATTAANGPPMSSLDADGKPVGVDPAFAEAIAGKLGLKIRWSDVPFDTVIPGVQAGRYDMALDNFTAKISRQKIVDQVTYLFEAAQLILASGSKDVTERLDMCGLTIGALKGSTDLDFVNATSEVCVAGGKKAINASVFPSSSAAFLAVQAGRADAAVGATFNEAYAVKDSKGTLKLSSYTYTGDPLGIVVPKSPGLAPAVLAAVQSMIKDGSYDAILDEYGITVGSLMKCPPKAEAPLCVTPGLNNSIKP